MQSIKILFSPNMIFKSQVLEVIGSPIEMHCIPFVILWTRARDAEERRRKLWSCSGRSEKWSEDVRRCYQYSIKIVLKDGGWNTCIRLLANCTHVIESNLLRDVYGFKFSKELRRGCSSLSQPARV